MKNFILKKQKTVIITLIYVILFSISLIISFSLANQIDNILSFQSSNKELRNYHYNGACKLFNGDYLIVCQNSTSHTSMVSKISSFRSTNKGVTWRYNGDIYNGFPIWGSNGATIGQAPNGTVICIFQRMNGTKNNDD